MVHYDPVADTSAPDPFAVYRRLRDDAPVYHNGERDIWALTRFDDVMAAVHAPSPCVRGPLRLRLEFTRSAS
jgi:cytochrome P450